MSKILSYKDIPYSDETKISDYLELLKPGVMSLVVYTAVIAMLVAPGDIHPVIAFIATLCVALGSGAAGAINMWYDRDIDAIMSRTKKRPIPSGRLDAQSVLHFGVGLACAAVLIMGVFVNFLAAFILSFAIFFYVFVYTIWLKRRTPQNIVIGGAAGAFPPMIGWAAVTNSISLESFLMFLIIFLWTPPHFWSLALAKSSDYEKASIPMLPNVKGHLFTKYQVLFYTIALSVVAIIPYFLGFWGVGYFVGASILSAIFLLFVWRLFQTNNHKFYLKTFGYSIFYLFALFGMMLLN